MQSIIKCGRRAAHLVLLVPDDSCAASVPQWPQARALPRCCCDRAQRRLNVAAVCARAAAHRHTTSVTARGAVAAPHDGVLFDCDSKAQVVASLAVAAGRASAAVRARLLHLCWEVVHCHLPCLCQLLQQQLHIAKQEARCKLEKSAVETTRKV